MISEVTPLLSRITLQRSGLAFVSYDSYETRLEVCTGTVAQLTYPSPSPRAVSCPWRCRNINLLPITCASRPRLRTRLTRSGISLLAETLGLRRPGFLTRLSATYVRISSCSSSSAPRRYAFTGCYNAPLPLNTLGIEPVASVIHLAPLDFRRRFARPVSYYALFQGWLLLSQPPGCLRASTTFST